ncbi:hypothetical protein PybrP1_012262 [[Pythium] brassicae (nom. inval.)]|nr:hypothetical protein PybrP1_012262 [[Pythium] brassicae (nom. inval.)]
MMERKSAKPASLRFGALLRASSSSVSSSSGPPGQAAPPVAAADALGDLDVAAMSPLCRQLLETKKRMLSALAAESSAGARSDDEDLLASDKPVKATPAGPPESALSPDAILQRKAQRRREQVRAASRRCRDRQRKETEDLRKKVFQLEEFIAHTIKSYEWELRQQQQQVEALARENARLAQRVNSPAVALADLHHRASSSSSVSPAGVDSAVFSVKTEAIAPFPRTTTPPSPPAPPAQHPSPVTGGSARGNAIRDQWRAYDDVDHMCVKVEETKRILSKILVPPAHPEIMQKAFGWEFTFWLEGPRYFAKSSKFFPGVRGYDIAQRMHRIEPAKYIETFPEVYAKKVLKVFHDNLKIVETVKVLPGKQPLGSVTVQFVSHDEEYAGNRCFFANRSVALPESSTFGNHDECNGYAFEDTTRIANDGRAVEGCLVQGVGGYDSMGRQPEVLMAELAKIFSSVVLRWESLFVNDYITEDDTGLADIEFDFEA